MELCNQAKRGFTAEEAKALARQIGVLAYTEYSYYMYAHLDPILQFLMYYAFETWTPPPKKSWYTGLIGSSS